MTTEAGRTAPERMRIERRYNAPVEDLWALWTTKDGFESWWGPEGFRVEVSELDPRVGGALSYDMIAVGKDEIAYMEKSGMPVSHGTHGTFTRIVPLELLEITHIIDFIPGVEPYENRMTMEFVREPNGVLMAVTIDRHIDDNWTRASIMGFESQLTKVPAALAALKREPDSGV